MHQERQLAGVDRDLGDGRRHRPEPEGETAAAAHQASTPILQDMESRLASEVSNPGIVTDLGHDGLLMFGQLLSG